MISVIGAIKLITAGGMLVTAYRLSKSENNQRKLKRCFTLGQMYLSEKKTLTLNGKRQETEKRIYPIVESWTDEQIRFAVPMGLDPDKIAKHSYIFRQCFGEYTELSLNDHYGTIHLYKKSLEPFKYNVDEISKLLDDIHVPIIAGKSRTGWEIYDMVVYPHLLITGETGAGKSTELRCVLTTLILFRGDRCEFLFADLKRSEFHLFRGIGTVVNDAKNLELMLKYVRAETIRRGDLLDQYEEAHIDDLPENVRPKYIILCIDEFALLKKEQKVMQLIEEISDIGRALGIFLILSCLRPDAKIMDGKLKQNLTVRMAYRAADGINSRITIGEEGAEEIKQSERGQMMFKLDTVKRVQSPLLTLDEAKLLLAPYKRKNPTEGVIDVVHEVVDKEEPPPIWGLLD